jgi:5'-nucleotidase (lipoprotein e(P4) family)
MIARSWRCRAILFAALLLIAGAASAAEPVPQNDLLNAELWMQTAVEYRANCLGAYALARLRLDEALADKGWTAWDQTGDYRELPPAVILDLDETAIDNSPYEAGLVVRRTRFDAKTWDAWVRAGLAKAVPGAVDFTRDAAAKGVKVFYITNRIADEKAATRRNLEALGFPLGGNVDTLMMRDGRSEKGVRIAAVAKDYRVLLLFGDNFADFTDAYTGSVADRAALFETLKSHFGHDWIMLANPAYGSWEGAPYAHQRGLSETQKRLRKIEALSPWPAAP